MCYRDAGQCSKCDAAFDNGCKRLSMQFHSVGTDRHVDAACLPEAGRTGDVAIEWRIDKHLNSHAGAARVKSVSHYLAGRDVPVENRGAYIQRSQVIGMQNEFAARQIHRHDGGYFKPDEVIALDRGVSHINADVSA